MTDSKKAADSDPLGRENPPVDPALSALIERQRALRSAWSALAPSGLMLKKFDIAETGRALNDELMELVNRNSSRQSATATIRMGARLDALESEMRAFAFKVPVAQLRSTLPQRLSADRRGVLDLLDLMLGTERSEPEGNQQHIPSIDYLITLLCTANSDQPPHDPVHLTPRLQELCERSSVDCNPQLPEIEAEFFLAADMYEADARGEHQLQAMRRRKTEIGSSFFAPRVLRAIVTYNAALLQRIDEEVLASLDWGSLPASSAEPKQHVSVFETPDLPKVAHALRRRAAGEAPEFNPIDRIAWCLDLSYLDESEHRALLCKSVGLREDPVGTTILIGLLCRASIVLEEEFPAIGISPSQLYAEWVPELAEALQHKVNRGIAGDDYREACLLSELKSKFLYTSMADAQRTLPSRAPAATSAPNRDSLSQTAREITKEALENERIGTRSDKHTGQKNWPWARMTAIAITTATVALVIGFGPGLLWNTDLERFDRDQLDEVSPYLSRGTRNGKGAGPAFVGRIRSGWSTLETADRTLVATDLVEALREQGVREIMIYDDQDRLRIQALGAQSPRVLPAGHEDP